MMQKKSTGQIMASRESSSSNSDDDSVTIKVITLNCWGLYGVSKFRKERIEAIGTYLSESEFDLVLLQEVWCSEDFQTIQRLTIQGLPYSHYFGHGVIGSGTCILSKYRLNNANFHEFTMNGYPTKFWHGDWYGGKGLGVCQLEIDGIDLTVFVSHTIAEYDPNHDIYLGHRVVHGLESAQWLNMTTGATDLTLYCGDFNTEPSTVVYRLLNCIVPLKDAWVEHTGEDFGGETCETAQNSFTIPGSKSKRIDYIMYRPGPSVEAETVNCWLPLPNKVPQQNFSYSDHEAVAAIFKVKKSCDSKLFQSGPEFRRCLSEKNRLETIQAGQDAIEIIDKSLTSVSSDQFKYVVYSFSILIFLVLSFIPSSYIPQTYFMAFDVGIFLPRFVMTIFLVIFFLMATIFNKRERNALISTKRELKLILNQDCSPIQG